MAKHFAAESPAPSSSRFPPPGTWSSSSRPSPSWRRWRDWIRRALPPAIAGGAAPRPRRSGWLAAAPPKLGYVDQDGDVQTFTERVTEYLSVTPLHNATGTPAISMPLHWTADGLPVGVHFAGRYGEEATLLALAAELETVQPWFDRVPAL